MSDNTVYDSVFKTMVHKAPRLIVPFVNEAFGRSYPLDAPVVQFSNEHEGPLGSTISDSVFRLQDKIYHVECQSTPDTDMVVRMIEYDFSIALEQALAKGAPYRMELPASCVLFLRHTSQTPDTLKMEVVLPDGGGSFEYRARVLKAQLVSSDDLFRKHLLLLLPYYLMRYEGELARIASDDGMSARLVAECTELRIRLAEQTLDEGDDLLYEEMTELIIRVSDHLLAAFGPLRRKVRAAMGGEVLELLNDRAARMEREAREQGFQRGVEQGIEQGIEQGEAQGSERAVRELSAQLSALGVERSLIDRAVAAMKVGPETL